MTVYKQKTKGIAFILILLLIAGMTITPANSFAASKKIKVSKVTITNAGDARTLNKGEKFKLKASVAPSNAKKKTVSYKSSKKSVATVSKKGVITAKKNGTATITVTARDGSKKKDTIKITVGQKVTLITAENAGAEHTLKKGEKKTFTVTVSPENAGNKKVIWSTGNKAVATVSAKGTVTAKKNGNATIYATAQDGSGKQMKTLVTVGTKAEKVTLSGESVLVKGKPSQLKATITPTGASNKKVVWASDNPAVATVSSAGKVTYVSDGSANITATAQDGTKKKGTYKVAGYTLTSASTKFIAHRGLSDSTPENTIPAFERACKAGFWGVECDVWETLADNSAPPPDEGGGDEIGDDDVDEDDGGETGKTGDDDDDDDDDDADDTTAGTTGGGITDPETTEPAITGPAITGPAITGPAVEYNRELMISHDHSLARMTGVSKNITSMTADAVKALTINAGNNISNYSNLKVPTLEEYLKVLKAYPKVNAVIELKSTTEIYISKEGIARMLELIEEYGMTERATIISFAKPSLEEVVKQSKERVTDGESKKPVKTMYLLNEAGAGTISYFAHVAWAYKTGIDAMSISSAIFTQDINKMTRDLGMETGLWTIDDPLKVMKFLLDYKVNYITSNKKLY